MKKQTSFDRLIQLHIAKNDIQAVNRIIEMQRVTFQNELHILKNIGNIQKAKELFEIYNKSLQRIEQYIQDYQHKLNI